MRPSTNEARNETIAPFLDEELSDDDIIKLARGYLERDALGRFGAFRATIAYLFPTQRS